MRQRTRIFTFCVAVLSGSVGLVWAAPNEAVCAMAGFSGWERLGNGTLIHSSRTVQDSARLAELVKQAHSRITQIFGPGQAQPHVVFFGPGDTVGPFRLNPYGSTAFLGSRACVLVGHRGENLDVIAHELMHAELFERVGYWRRWVDMPTWFDEGLAMQVDHRPAYELPAAEPVNSVRALDTAHEFFVADDAKLTWNYAAAKREVAQWLAVVGADGIYPRLARLRAGETLEKVMHP